MTDAPAPYQRNETTGKVHRATCSMIGHSVHMLPYDPARPGHNDVACTFCLPRGLPT